MSNWRAEIVIAMAVNELRGGDPSIATSLLGPYVDELDPDAFWTVPTVILGAAAYAAEGRSEEARRILRRVDVLAGSNMHARVLHGEHLVRALVAIDDPRALEIARDLVSEADALGDEDTEELGATTRLGLAYACLAAGRTDEAIAVAAEAEARLRARGMSWLAARAHGIGERARAIADRRISQ
jgi:hypothetical protein